jgi:hypothetical protein
MTLVRWRDREGGPGGTCVEVSRDDAATDALTLCGMHVTLPGPMEEGDPTCAQCRVLAKAGAKGLMLSKGRGR